MGFNRIVAASIALVLLLAALTGAFAYIHLESNTRALFWVNRTQAVIEGNQQLLAELSDAQAAEQVFLANNDPRSLEDYHTAARGVVTAQNALAALASDDPVQTARANALNRLISQRLATLDHAMNAGRSAGASDRSASAGEDITRAMREIRRRSTAIADAERTRLAMRVRDLNRDWRTELMVGLSVAGVAMLGLIALILDLWMANRRLVRAIARAEAALVALDAADALTKAVFANAGDYLFVIQVREGDQFLIGDINPALERALGVSASEIRGQSISALLTPANARPLIAHYRQVRVADRPVLSRYVIPFGVDGPRTWESILAPVKNVAGQTDRIVGSSRDITDRLKTEARLREAQRMEAVGQLTGGVAHDFNNILQVIRGNLELLEDNFGGGDREKRRLINAIHAADRAAQLTRQLLAFARRQPLTPQVINLSRLIKDMTDLLRRTLGEGIAVETIVAENLWNTLADPAQVESAVLNLAINARDAMPQGGRLSFEISNALLDEAYARQVAEVTPGQYVLIAVCDTGGGMTPDIVARVFEPFFTTKADGKGNGLGLSMVYGFVRQSNGHVRIYSEPGQGTTVKIYLPRASGAVAPLPATIDSAPRGSDQLILVVEDDEAVRFAAVGMLEGLGYRCLEAANPEIALRVLETALARNSGVALVFSDVVMPGPLNIREFAARVEALSPGMPILFTSGYTQNALVHDGRLEDGVTLLSKPYARAEMANAIATMLAITS